MPLTKITQTGINYLEKEVTQADGVGFFSHVQHYEKQLGSAGIGGNTIFTLTKPYVIGSNTLMVFVNGQKAELVTSPSNQLEYEETDLIRVTFGLGLDNNDVVEFMVLGTYELLDTTQLFMPVGFVFPVVNSNVVPTGTLECNGALISQTTYAALFSGQPLSIGSNYGTSGGSFYLPDFRGRNPRGWDHGIGRDPDAASRFADQAGGAIGNNVGSMQNDNAGVGTHNHLYKQFVGTTVPHWAFDPSGNPINMGVGLYQLSGPARGLVLAVTSGDGHADSQNYYTANAGAAGNEGRGKNFYSMYCIKY